MDQNNNKHTNEIRAGKFYIPRRDNLRIQHDWHMDCYLECKYVKRDVRSFWCDKHHQNVYEFPIQIDYVFNNGEIYQRNKD